jgi:hypothetical protein
VLNRFAWPGYTSTLAEPRLYGVLSRSSAATSRTAAPTTPPNRRSEFASISATSDKSANFQGLRHRRVFRSFLGAGCVYRPFGSLALPVSDRVALHGA